MYVAIWHNRHLSERPRYGRACAIAGSHPGPSLPPIGGPAHDGVYGAFRRGIEPVLKGAASVCEHTIRAGNALAALRSDSGIRSPMDRRPMPLAIDGALHG